MTARSGPGIEIRLQTPRVLNHRAEFSWLESQPSGLYQKNSFYLAFPESVPLPQVPMRLWWMVFMLCLHVHWALLRPCRIHLPIRLAPEEVDLWLRLLGSYADTLDALNPGRKLPPDIDILVGDTPLESVPPLEDKRLCAAAFSGGKDSLAQVGLLCEMGYTPLLVTTTSSMPGVHLGDSVFRNRALAEVQKRRGIELIEVHSDLRTHWDNLITRRWGYSLSLNELTDTLLYTAVLAVTGYARGATQLFLASENEVATNVVRDGIYLQHSHFMYSALTQAGIDALLRPFGLHYGSLTVALHSSQVQELVTRRYRDLSDLQCTCWRTTETRRACSECSECKRLAWVTLARGGEPADQGVDMVWMLNHYDKHMPRSQRDRPHPPNKLTSARFRTQIATAILDIPLGRLLGYLLRQHPRAFVNGSGWRAMSKFQKIQKKKRIEYPDPLPAVGYRRGYLRLLADPVTRERLEAIFADQFGTEPEANYAEQLANLRNAIAHVTQSSRPLPQGEKPGDPATR